MGAAGPPGPRMLRPVRPDIGADQAARRAHHARAERHHHRVIGQPIGLEPFTMVAPGQRAIDEQAAAAVAANVAQRDRLECFSFAIFHERAGIDSPPQEPFDQLEEPDRGRADSYAGEDETAVAIEVCEPLCHLTAGPQQPDAGVRCDPRRACPRL